MKKQFPLYDAEHPFRQAAIHIIEEIIEEKLKLSLKREKYYETEDQIVDILVKYVGKPSH